MRLCTGLPAAANEIATIGVMHVQWSEKQLVAVVVALLLDNDSPPTTWPGDTNLAIVLPIILHSAEYDV